MVIDTWSRYFVELLRRLVCQLTISLHTFLRSTFHITRPWRETKILQSMEVFQFTPRKFAIQAWRCNCPQYLCLFHVVFECSPNFHDQRKMLVLPNRSLDCVLDEDNTSKDPFSRCKICKNFGTQIELTMTGHNRTTTSRKKELCTLCSVCVVKCSWRIQPSCWTLRRPTPMTTWKPTSRETPTRSTWNPTMTWHTWWTREHARSVSLLSPCSVSVTLIPCTHRMALNVRVFVSSHPCMKWAFPLTSLLPPSPSSSFSHSSLCFSSSYPSTSPKLSSNSPVHFAKEMVSTDESFSNISYEPKDYFLAETYVEFNQESMTEQRFGSSKTSITMSPQSVRCSLSHTVNKSITPSEKACLLVSRRRQFPIERCNPLLQQWQKATMERSNPLLKQVKNKTLDMHRLGPCWTDRGSKSAPAVRRRLENTNSRLITTEEVNKNQVKRSNRSKKNFIALKQKNFIDEINNFFMNSYWSKFRITWSSPEKSQWNGRVKEGSTFDTIARRKLVDDQNTTLELTGRIQELQMKLIVWMIREISKMLNQYAVDIPTLPINLCLSHLINSWWNDKPFCGNAEPQRRAAKHLGHAW